MQNFPLICNEFKIICIFRLVNIKFDKSIKLKNGDTIPTISSFAAFSVLLHCNTVLLNQKINFVLAVKLNRTVPRPSQTLSSSEEIEQPLQELIQWTIDGPESINVTVLTVENLRGNKLWHLTCFPPLGDNGTDYKTYLYN